MKGGDEAWVCVQHRLKDRNTAERQINSQKLQAGVERRVELQRCAALPPPSLFLSTAPPVCALRDHLI